MGYSVGMDHRGVVELHNTPAVEHIGSRHPVAPSLCTFNFYRDPSMGSSSTEFHLYLISFIPGEEYISNCRRPFRIKYSMAPKSFLSREMLFWNSALQVVSKRPGK